MSTDAARQPVIVQHILQTGPALFHFSIGITSSPQDPCIRVVFTSDSYRSQQLALACGTRYVQDHVDEILALAPDGR